MLYSVPRSPLELDGSEDFKGPLRSPSSASTDLSCCWHNLRDSSTLRRNNPFGALVFTSYGAFWVALGFLFFSAESLGVLANAEAAVGFTLVGWTVFTFYVCIAALKVNKAMFATFAVFLITLLFLDLGFLFAVQGFIIAGGYTGILLAICAWYTSAANVINPTFRLTALEAKAEKRSSRKPPVGLR
jgi:succinate-acetate transporter protein